MGMHAGYDPFVKIHALEVVKKRVEGLTHLWIHTPNKQATVIITYKKAVVFKMGYIEWEVVLCIGGPPSRGALFAAGSSPLEGPRGQGG